MEAEAETKVVPGASKRDGDERDESEGRPASDSGSGPDLVSHRLVGRYELIHRLGHGGMATVYLGRAVGKAGFERLVAMKVIHPHLASEPEFVEMFLDEARIAAKIHHPHVVEIIDLGEDDDVLFMVMEYVEGDTLASLLRQLRKAGEHLPLGAALQVVADACGGLAAAHDLIDRDGSKLKLVHRDISPHNLLVSVSGRVKVVDFGIMKAAGKRSSTLTGQLRGKLAYMSPEQARARPVDHRTDLFALGCVLWELCTNEKLFSAENESATLELVTRCEVPDPISKRADLPPAVAKILQRALQPRPDDRYPSAVAMQKDLRVALRGLDDDDPRESLAAAMRRFFSGRIEYIRATIRGNAANDRAHRSSSQNLGFAARSATRLLGEDTATPSVGSAAARSRLTPSTTHTPTTGIAAAPARNWFMWLLLPLVGAALGTAAMGWDQRSSETPETVPAAVAKEAEPAPEPAPVVPSEPVQLEPQPPPEPALIKWHLDSRPSGATVSIDGARQEGTTPFLVMVPPGDGTLAVVFEKEGFKPCTQNLAPVSPGNFSCTLHAVEPARKRARPKKRLTAPRAAVEGTPAPAKAPPSAEEPKRSSPAFPDVPAFGGKKRRSGKPGPKQP